MASDAPSGGGPSTILEEEFDAAEDLREAGDLPAAFDKHRALYEVFVCEQPDDPADIDSQENRRIVLEGYSRVAEELGRYREAADAVAKLLPIWQRFGNRFEFDCAAVRLSRLLNAAGKAAEAEEMLGRLACNPGRLDFPTNGDRPDFAAWEGRFRWNGVAPSQADRVIVPALRELGRIEALHGRYRNAIALLERAIRRCAVNDPGRPALVVELAAARHESGDFPGARRELDRLSKKSDISVRVRALEIEGWIDWLEGLPRRTIRSLDAAAGLLVNEGMAEPAAREWLNLAAFLIASNSLVRADRALDSAQAATPDSAVQARVKALRELSRRRGASKTARGPQSVTELWGRGKPAGPAARLGTRPMPAIQSSSFLGRFEAACLGLYALWGDDDFEGAARLYEQLQAEFGHTDSRIVQAQLGCLGGLVAYHAGEFARAVERLDAAASDLHQANVYFYEWQCMRYLSWAQAKLGEAAAAGESRRQSERIMERIADTLSPVDRAIYLLNKWTEEEAHLSAELRQADAPAASGFARLLPPLAQWNRLRRIDDAMRYIDDHRRITAGRGQKTPSEFATLLMLRRAFSKPVLRFVVLPDEVEIIFVHKWSAEILRSTLNRVGIRALVARFHQHVDRARQGESDAAAEAGAALRQISTALRLPELLSTVEAGELRILGDDCLHGVPFAALPLDDRTLLVDRFAVSIGSEWRVPPRPKASEGGEPLIGALSYVGLDVPVLAGARAEGDAVAEALGAHRAGEKLLTKEFLCSRLPGSRLAHLVCHGEFRPDDPGSSGLRVRAANGQTELLSILDFAEMDLSRVEHIALSCCWGADDYVSPGRIIISLPETLLQSGAAVVLASLWPLNDAVAPGAMAAYYRHLRTVSAAEALRRVQLELRSRFPSWYFWAGLRVYSQS